MEEQQERWSRVAAGQRGWWTTRTWQSSPLTFHPGPPTPQSATDPISGPPTGTCGQRHHVSTRRPKIQNQDGPGKSKASCGIRVGGVRLGQTSHTSFSQPQVAGAQEGGGSRKEIRTALREVLPQSSRPHLPLSSCGELTEIKGEGTCRLRRLRRLRGPLSSSCVLSATEGLMRPALSSLLRSLTVCMKRPVTPTLQREKWRPWGKSGHVQGDRANLQAGNRLAPVPVASDWPQFLSVPKKESCHVSSTELAIVGIERQTRLAQEARDRVVRINEESRIGTKRQSESCSLSRVP